MMTRRKFGRVAIPDQRDRRFLLPRGDSARTCRYWNANGWWGDQGTTSQCVPFAWLHWLEDGPITHKHVPPPLISPPTLYKEAKKLDEWEGQDYEGTSVRGGVKALKRRGLIGEYRWAFTLDRVIHTLLELGPVVVGTDWYVGMSEPGRDHYLRLDGDLEGGHAYVLDGINLEQQRVRVKNSWGRNWARNGFAWLALSSLQALLRADGECCLATELSTKSAAEPLGGNMNR